MMKKITLLIFALGISTLSFGQYYYLPTLPGNPGGLNTDIETTWNTMSGLGWSDVQASSSTDVWSSNQTIPFSFTLNGTAQTSYKVSTTGVLTFDLAAVSVPSSSNGSLPSVSIPDNSICVWGLEVSGSNDRIASKTFGTSPNRQHWISFLSASNPSQSQTNYTYWSIVLEETTNKIYIVDQQHRRAPDLTVGVQFSGSSAISLPASPNVSNVAGTDNTAADNVYYTFLAGTLPGFDLAGIELNMPNTVALSSAPFSLNGAFKNLGFATTSNVEVNYTINGGSVVTGNYSGLNIVKFTTGYIYHPTTWTPAALGNYNIKMWVSKINGSVDSDLSNDTISFTVQVANTVGIDENVNSPKFSLYPNPVNDVINIKIAKEWNQSKIELINTIGQSVYSHDLYRNNIGEIFEINVGNFKPGIYFVKVSSAGQSSIQKLIIN